MNDLIKSFVADNTVLLVAGVASLLFKEFIINIVKSLVFRITADLKEDDIVTYWEGDKMPARIVRLGWFSTTLFLYDVNSDGVVTGGHRITLQNSRLSDVKFLKRLSMIEKQDIDLLKK